MAAGPGPHGDSRLEQGRQADVSDEVLDALLRAVPGRPLGPGTSFVHRLSRDPRATEPGSPTARLLLILAGWDADAPTTPTPRG